MENNYFGKKVLFMGDSITALGGWVREYKELMKPSVAVNIAVSGARWQDDAQTVYDGKPFMDCKGELNNRVGNQLEKLLRGKDESNPNYSPVPEYEDFDVIIIAAGTNDGGIKGLYEGSDELIHSQFIAENGSVVPLESLDRKTWPGIMRYVYEKLRHFYPSAAIFYCTPIQAVEELRPYASIKAKRELMIKICDRLSDVNVIDTFNCGVCGIYEVKGANGRDLIDGLHPNKSGELKLARCISRAVKEYFL